MWRVHKDAGRPWPSFSADPVVDYMVMEAVYLRAQQQDAEDQKVAERKAAQKAAMKELAQTHG